MNGKKYLIWSNEHHMWWRAGRRGYTPHIEEAGRYERAEADEIVELATCGGVLTIARTDPYTQENYAQVSEWVVQAPEFNDLARRLDPGE